MLRNIVAYHARPQTPCLLRAYLWLACCGLPSLVKFCEVKLVNNSEPNCSAPGARVPLLQLVLALGEVPAALPSRQGREVQ